MKKIIIQNTYEGYLWWSDQDKPIVYEDGKVFVENEELQNANKEIELLPEQNPFVVEGQLYDKANKKSYSIKYVDGNYIIRDYHIESTDISNSDLIDKKEYVANRMGKRLLKVLRYWHDVKDPLCEDMDVLTVEKFVFVGFKKMED